MTTKNKGIKGNFVTISARFPSLPTRPIYPHNTRHDFDSHQPVLGLFIHKPKSCLFASCRIPDGLFKIVVFQFEWVKTAYVVVLDMHLAFVAEIAPVLTHRE